jgi:hypothetical protein
MWKAPLPKHHVSALCTVLWQKKMVNSASFAPKKYAIDPGCNELAESGHF